MSIASKAGRFVAYASHYGKKAVKAAKEGQALIKYSKKLTKPQLKSQIKKAERLKGVRPLTKRENVILGTLKLRLAQKSRETRRRKATKRRRR